MNSSVKLSSASRLKYCSHKAVDSYIWTHCSSIKCLFHPMFFMPHLLHAQSTMEECSNHQFLVNLHATQHICPVNHGRVLQASTSGRPTAQHLCFSCFMPSPPWKSASNINFWSPYNPTVCASAVSCSCLINYGRVLQVSTSGHPTTQLSVPQLSVVHAQSTMEECFKYQLLVTLQPNYLCLSSQLFMPNQPWKSASSINFWST